MFSKERSKLKSRVVPPAKPYFTPDDISNILREAEAILKSGMLTLGTYTKDFEKEYAKICEVRHAIAVNSGTSALEVALRAMGLENGDEVLIPTNTFSATAAAVIFAGGRPILTDIDTDSLCINVENVQRYITHKTKGVIAVHIGGLICPEIEEIRKMCSNFNLFLLEDAAHAHGSKLEGQPAGSFGDAGCFSFYPTKVMTTGEGGMITTNKDELAAKAEVLRDQGKENFRSNTIVELGYNWRMDEISAAIGLMQLRRLPEMIEKRNKIANYYDGELNNIDYIKPLKKGENVLHNYYKYLAFLDPRFDREKFKERLRALGVRCGGEVYWPPLHLQPIFQKLLGTRKGDFPMAEDVCSRIVSLPMYTQMTLEETEYVIENIKGVLSQKVQGD